jgi:acetylornithine aminotransferase
MICLDNVAKMGTYLVSNFQVKLSNSNKMTQIRAKGLMIAIEVNQDCTQLLNAALSKHLLINITGRSIRLLPPLIINQTEADIIIDTICDLIGEL